MKKTILFLLLVLSISLIALSNQASAQVLTVNGSQSPGTIFVAKIEFGQLLPPVTIFFGAGPAPAHPTPTTITHALGNPVNERGFSWPKENFVVFGGNTGFFTTGTGTLSFSSPSPAVDAVALYSVTPAGGAFVGSIGYAFPSASADIAHGTYNVTIGISALPLNQSVGFTLKWIVVPEFDLLVTPLNGATGDFGAVSFGEGAQNQEFIISTRTNQGESYVITLSTPGITNQFGTTLDGIKVFSDGISGNSLRNVEIPISVATPVAPDQEIVLYRSNPQGNSDFFNFGIAIVPSFGQQAGDYSGSLVLTMVSL